MLDLVFGRSTDESLSLSVPVVDGGTYHTFILSLRGAVPVWCVCVVLCCVVALWTPMADSLVSTSQQQVNTNYSAPTLTNQSIVSHRASSSNITANNLWAKFSSDQITDGFALRITIVSAVGLVILLIVFALGWVGRKKMRHRSHIYYYSIQGAQLMQTFSAQ